MIKDYIEDKTKFLKYITIKDVKEVQNGKITKKRRISYRRSKKA